MFNKIFSCILAIVGYSLIFSILYSMFIIFPLGVINGSACADRGFNDVKVTWDTRVYCVSGRYVVPIEDVKRQ